MRSLLRDIPCGRLKPIRGQNNSSFHPFFALNGEEYYGRNGETKGQVGGGQRLRSKNGIEDRDVNDGHLEEKGKDYRAEKRPVGE